ncbi:MAG TPA: LysR family transcriptional regulator [Caulobacteraceae bacterium]|jgi:DNA-binding transcriptional LysR family regulator|nr:LysR family transcriptional regulator [Caulobacteraceae bacterium]
MRNTANDDEDLWRGLDWNDVRIFLAVAESGSLNAAARSLGMTQPTISRRMEELEFRLNARLLLRSSRGIALTDAGLAVRDHAANMARLGAVIMREVSGRDSSDAGRVRLVAPDGLASFNLMPRLAEFQRAHPDIQMAVDCGLWPDSPLEGAPDLSLEFTGTAPPGVVSIPIATFHYAYFASRAYLELYGAPTSAAEITQQRMVRHTSHREQPHTWNPQLAAVNALAGTHLISNSSAATFMAIKQGVGLGILPTQVATFEPDLVMLDLEPMAHPVLFLRHDPSAVRQSRVQRVKDWILEVFDPATNPWYRDEYIHPRDFARFMPAPGGATVGAL